MKKKELTIPISKFCSSCKKIKLLIDFANDKNRRWGVCTYCKTCSNIRRAAYYIKHRSEELIKRRLQRLNNIDYYKTYGANWRKKNAEYNREYGYKWRAAHPNYYKKINNV